MGRSSQAELLHTLHMHIVCTNKVAFNKTAKYKRHMLQKPAKIIANKLNAGEYVLRAKKSQSRLWKVFRQIDDRNGAEVINFVQCQICKNILRFRASSTSNLVKHRCYVNLFLRRESPISIIDVEIPKLEVQKVENIGDINNNLIKLITQWIINDCVPYSRIQDAALLAVFQEFISLGAQFRTDVDVNQFLPSSKTIEKNVAEVYEHRFKVVKSEISAIKENSFGLTADIWTETPTKQSYLALNIHFLKNETLRFCLLGLRLLDGEMCTTQNIDDTVGTILADFDCELSNNTIIVTRSNGDVMKSLNNVKKLPCITTLLNNALQQSVEEVTQVAELASACLQLVNYLKESSQEDNFVNSLQNVVPSRWNTIYKMLIFIESNWSEICDTVANKNENKRIEAVNINYLQAVSRTLQPFEEAIESLEDVNEATLHLVLIYLHELKKMCDTNDSEFIDFDFIQRLKEELQHRLERIFTENISILHKIALFLYPPTNKLLPFDDEQKKSIERACIRLCLENESRAMTTSEVEISNAPAVKRNKLFSDFTEHVATQNPDELIIQEIQCYKCLHVENTDDFDCFGWWQLHKDIFPYLYRLSCTILTTPASAALTEQIFSGAETFLRDALNYGSNETEVEKIIFINFNEEPITIDSL